MKTLLTTLLLTITSLTIFASSATIEKVFSIEQFSRLKVASTIEAHLEQGTDNVVKVQASENVMERVIVEIVNGELLINLEDKNGRLGKVVVHINTDLSQIEGVRVSSSASIDSKDPLTAPEINIRLSSSAKLSTEVKTKKLGIETSSSSSVNLDGVADYVKVKSSSSSNVNLRGVRIEDITVTASSSATIKTNHAKIVRAEKLSSNAKVICSENTREIHKGKLSSNGEVLLR